MHRVAWMDFRALVPGDEFPNRQYYEPFRERLAEHGFVHGSNLELRLFPSGIEKRRAPDLLAADAIAWDPHAIVVRGAAHAKRMMRATSTVPIVFSEVNDPVADGLVQDPVRPGRNATGVTSPIPRLALKRFEYIRQVFPKARRVAVLIDRTTGNPTTTLTLLGGAAPSLGLTIEEADAGGKGLPPVLARLAITKPDVVLIAGIIEDNHYFGRLVDFQNATRIPVIDDETETAKRGALLALAQDARDTYRRTGDIVARILKGAKAAETPVDESTRIELAVNLRAARSLGIAIPADILARADLLIDRE